MAHYNAGVVILIQRMKRNDPKTEPWEHYRRAEGNICEQWLMTLKVKERKYKIAARIEDICHKNIDVSKYITQMHIHAYSLVAKWLKAVSMYLCVHLCYYLIISIFLWKLNMINVSTNALIKLNSLVISSSIFAWGRYGNFVHSNQSQINSEVAAATLNLEMVYWKDRCLHFFSEPVDWAVIHLFAGLKECLFHY